MRFPATVTLATIAAACSTPATTEQPDEPTLVIVSAGRSGRPDEPLSAITVEVRNGTGGRSPEAIEVTVALTPRPDALHGTTRRTTNAGRAVFDDLTIDTLGGYTLRFTAPGLEPATVEFGIVTEPPAAAATGPWLIEGVSVMPMTGGPDAANQSVLVEQGRITAIGPRGTITVPPGTTTIDGTGRWLTPGLVDFHTHERGFPNWPDDIPGNLIMYLANGVTTIVNMGDFTGGLLPYRAAVASGELPGPRSIVGQIVRGPADGGFPIVANGTQAVEVAQRARADGYDFLKIYSQVPAAAFDALVAAGRAEGLAVTGHSSLISLSYAISHGQVMVAHSSEFLRLLTGSSTAALDAVAQQAAAAGVTVTATLYVGEVVRDYGLAAIGGRDLNELLTAYPGAEFMDDAALLAWRGALQNRPDVRTPTDRSGTVDLVARLTGAFQRAGVRLLLGSDDIGIPSVVPGFATTAELRSLAAALGSATAALEAGTRNAGTFSAEHFGIAEPFGVVAVGARADLVLHDRDPRADLSSFVTPAGVMAAGRWYPGEWLAAQLERLRYVR
ncbi:MAG: amidohydrolase family protein [Gemmatimonadales bacterium]